MLEKGGDVWDFTKSPVVKTLEGSTDGISERESLVGLTKDLETPK